MFTCGSNRKLTMIYLLILHPASVIPYMCILNKLYRATDITVQTAITEK